jgi:hypothetical protein
MTEEEFDNKNWKPGVLVKYTGKRKKREVACVDFHERSVGLATGYDFYIWKSYKDIEFIDKCLTS